MTQYISLQSEAFDIGKELMKLSNVQIGAISSFTGIVRSERDINALWIEHHSIMTRRSMERLVKECCAKYGLMGAILVHRYGLLKLGQPIVLVAASSKQRKDSMQAVQYMMDRLKTDVPLWKKEIAFDGSSAWVEQKQSDVENSQKWMEK